MIGVDTNVLVRWLVADDAAQHRLATSFISDAGSDALHLSDIVLVELVWVLTRTYRYSNEDALSVVETLLDMQEFVTDHRGMTLEALELARQYRCDFADALAGLSNRQAGCTTTVTFDRGAARLPIMTALDSFLS